MKYNIKLVYYKTIFQEGSSDTNLVYVGNFPYKVFQNLEV
jgi:hypothetical protein